jgi:hypothetical protein
LVVVAVTTIGGTKYKNQNQFEKATAKANLSTKTYNFYDPNLLTFTQTYKFQETHPNLHSSRHRLMFVAN